jgi:hypothetical protein
MKSIILCIFILVSWQAFSRDTKLCGIKKIKNIHSEILKLGRNDKFMHCSASCQLGVNCGTLTSINLGILKEVWDTISPGDASFKDLLADYRGLKEFLSKRADTNQTCIDQCAVIYPE